MIILKEKLKKKRKIKFGEFIGDIILEIFIYINIGSMKRRSEER